MRDGAAGWPADARICLRIGAMNDKTIVEAAQDSFDVLVLQANLAISAPRGLSSWQVLDKPFWIDPIAYAFAARPAYLMSEQKIRRGHPETHVDFKRTFRDLARAYGEPFTRVLDERRSLRPADFDPAADEEIASRMLEWQRTILQPPEEDMKYLDTPTLEPVLLTVPFFPLQRPRDSDDPAWLDVNLRLAEAAARLYPPERLAVGFLIEDSLFDTSDAADQLLDRYLELPVDHFWFWISENEEVDMTVPRAQRLRTLVQRAAAAGRVVHQAFGGTFSALLLSEGLASIGYGVAYWEHKNWEPLAGGGLPTLRFFYPPLGERLRFLDADAIVDAFVSDAAEFHDLICACPTCERTLERDLVNFGRYGLVEVRSRIDSRGHRIEYDVPVPDALQRSKLHYLQTRAREIHRFVAPEFDAAAWLQASIDRYQQQQVVEIRHLTNWLAVLEVGETRSA